MEPSDWDSTVAKLSEAGRSDFLELIERLYSAGWEPSEEDTAQLKLVGSGTRSYEDFAAELAVRWEAKLPSSSAGTSSEMASTVVSATVAARARWLLHRAKDAKVVIERVRKTPAGGADTAWLKQVARETLDKAGPNGMSGALGQFRGHLFEHLDIEHYNLKNLPRGRVLRLRLQAHAPGYDASRYIRGRFAGGIQHKLGAGGVVKAVDKLNARKAGSATRATLRLPKDQAARASVRVAGRMRVQASEISTATVKRRGNAGLRQLSARGSAAVSPMRQFSRGAGFAAVSGAAVGALSDAARIYRREISAHEFATRRGADAVEQSASTLASIAAVAGVAATLKSVAAGGSILAASAAAAATSSVVVPLAVSAGVGSAVVYSMRPFRRRAEAWAADRAAAAARRGESSVTPRRRVRIAGQGRRSVVGVQTEVAPAQEESNLSIGSEA